MKYQLFVAEKCTECQLVIDYVMKNNIDTSIHNVDTEGLNPPIAVFAFPALFLDNILLGYGSDIVNYLEKKA